MNSCRIKKITGILMTLVIVSAVCLADPVESQAYFDRGTVGLTLGKTSVTLETGQSETVSVTFSPSSSSQLPGCGMAECPQVCGEKECLDENGECTCNGTTYTTYYATATVSSGNTSVATASYSSGVLTINAVSAGTAVISVTSVLRQFTSTTVNINVTVTSKSSGGSTDSGSSSGGSTDSSGSSSSSGSTSSSGSSSSSGSTDSGSSSSSGSAGSSGSSSTGGSTSSSGSSSSSGSTSSSGSSSTGGSTSSSGSSSSSGSTSSSGSSSSSGSTSSSSTGGNTSSSGSTSSSGTVSANRVTESGTAQSEDTSETVEGTDAADDEESEYTAVESDRGTIYFVPIQVGAMGSEFFELISGTDAYVDFQMKDEADTVLYAWEFYGKDLNSTDDAEFTIDLGTDPFDGADMINGGTTVYVAASQAGAFPGPASLYIRVSEYFENGQELNAYKYEDGQAVQIDSGLITENGYVTLNLTEGGNYILTTETISGAEIAEETDNSGNSADTSDEAADAAASETEDDGGFPVGGIIGIAAAVVVICAAVIILIRRRKNKEDGGEIGEPPSDKN